MTSKTPPPNFFPAPRPRPINEPGMTEALDNATRDLGFGRPTSSPATDAPAFPGEPAPAPTSIAAVAAPAPRPSAPQPKTRPAASKPAAKPAPVVKVATMAPFDDDGRLPSLRVEITHELWDALRMRALQRRVTVKYLVYEALAAQGFDIDLNDIPEDGRRRRKSA